MTADHDAIRARAAATAYAHDILDGPIAALLDDCDALAAEVERLKKVVGNWMLRSDNHRADRDAARARVADLEAEVAAARAENASLNISYEALAESITPAAATGLP